MYAYNQHKSKSKGDARKAKQRRYQEGKEMRQGRLCIHKGVLHTADTKMETYLHNNEYQQ